MQSAAAQRPPDGRTTDGRSVLGCAGQGVASSAFTSVCLAAIFFTPSTFYRVFHGISIAVAP